MAGFLIGIATLMFTIGCFTSGTDVETCVAMFAAVCFAHAAGVERGQTLGEKVGRTRERIELMSKREERENFLRRRKK